LVALAVERMPVMAELTGPAALTAAEICQITGTITGERLSYQALDEPSYRERMARAGAQEWLIEAYSSMFASVREGRFEAVSADIPDLIGTPQQSYAEFIAATPP
jgi:NAD(P)H dehydrogenase (quinone)